MSHASMMGVDITTWTAALARVLEDEGTASLVQAPHEGESGFDVRLAIKDGCRWADILKNASVAMHLCAWPGAGDLVVWLAHEGGSSRPLLLIRDQSLLIVSGDAEAFQSTAPNSTRALSFDAWFCDLTGNPIPIDLGPLVKIDENLYGPREDTEADYRQLNWALLRRGWRNEIPEPYTAVSFAGYGCNSWALYVTRVLGPTRMVLRLAHGGLYLDPTSSVQRLLANLTEAVQLQDEAAARGISMYLNHNMGSWAFTFEALQLQPHNGFPTNSLRKAANLREVAAQIRLGANGPR